MRVRGKTRVGMLALGGLAAVGGGAVLLRRRMASDGTEPVQHVATVATPPNEVRTAWTEAGRPV